MNNIGNQLNNLLLYCFSILITKSFTTLFNSLNKFPLPLFEHLVSLIIIFCKYFLAILDLEIEDKIFEMWRDLLTIFKRDFKLFKIVVASNWVK